MLRVFVLFAVSTTELQRAFELEMRGGKAIAEEQVAKKPSGKEMFLRHLVAEEAEVAEGEEDEDGGFCWCCS